MIPLTDSPSEMATALALAAMALKKKDIRKMKEYTPAQIAKICHEVNRATCSAFGDHSQLAWEDAPSWQKESAISGVDFALGNPGAPASAQHDAWLEAKRADGWTYGPVKDAEAKTHPCCVPYDELPPEQKLKDYLFQAVVRSCRE